MNKRLLKYIIHATGASVILFKICSELAYIDRGYKAIGGEIFIPFFVVCIFYCIYKRQAFKELADWVLSAFSLKNE